MSRQYLEGQKEGYKIGIIHVLEALNNLKDAKIYYGHLVVDEPNCLFLSAENVECAIYITPQTHGTTIKNNSIISNGYLHNNITNLSKLA